MRNLLLIAALTIPLYSQTATVPVVLQISQSYNITSSGQIFDNRSAQRQCNIYTFAVTSGSGSWQAQLEWSNSANGPWYSFGGPAVINYLSSSPIGFGYTYRPFVRINTTAGSTASNFTCESGLFIPSPTVGATISHTANILAGDSNGNGISSGISISAVSNTLALSSTALQPSATVAGDLSGLLLSPTVVKINGASVPASQTCLATNGSSQLVAGSGCPTIPSTLNILAGNNAGSAVSSGISTASVTTAITNSGTALQPPASGTNVLLKGSTASHTTAAAVAGTDYAAPTTGSSLLGGNGSGGFTVIPGSLSGGAVTIGVTGTPGSVTLAGLTSGSAALSVSATGSILQQGRASGTYSAASSGTGVVDYWAYNVNNYLPIWEFAGNAAPINQALVGLMNTPTDVANIFNTGVSGYCRGTVQDAFCVGVFGLGLTAAQPAAGHAIQAWGANFAVSNCGKIFCADGDGMSSSNITGIEVDASSFKTAGGQPATNMVGVYVTGSSTSQTATTMDGFQLQPAPVTLVPWKRGYVLGVGATNGEGISLGAAAAGNTQGSQNITMHGTSGGGVDEAGRISVDAFGDVIITPYLTAGVVLQNGSGVTMAQAGPTAFQVSPRSTDPGCTISTDIGKWWIDTATSTTNPLICLSVSGTVGWSSLTHTP